MSDVIAGTAVADPGLHRTVGRVPHRGHATQLLGEIAREALFGLVRNRVRAGLSMLGISWGIVSVVMLLAYGEGFNQALIRGFHGAFGDGVTIMFPQQTSMQAGGERAGKRLRLRLSDAGAGAPNPPFKSWGPGYKQGLTGRWETPQTR